MRGSKGSCRLGFPHFDARGGVLPQDFVVNVQKGLKRHKDTMHVSMLW